MPNILPNAQYNYSQKLRFGWLLDGLAFNHSRVHIRVENFANECHAEFLHIFDGDGIYSKRLGSLRTSFAQNAALQKKEFVAESGQAFIYLHCETACSISGLNISYRFDSCLDECNGNGICNVTTGTCICKDYKGPSCKEPLCSRTCSPTFGKCQIVGEDEVCECKKNYQGPYCNITSGESVWKVVNEKMPYGVASHAVTLVNENVWLIGGYTFSNVERLIVLKYNFEKNNWSIPTTTAAPKNRYGHTVVEFENNLYMFGGLVSSINITNEFWKLDLTTMTWSAMLVQNFYGGQQPLQVTGHTAHVVGNVMLVFFGLNPYLGFINLVQQYNFANGTWSVVQTSGAIPSATFGHTSVLDSNEKVIFLYGGYRAVSSSAGEIIDELYHYDIARRRWKLLRSSGLPSVLHSAVLMSGVIVILSSYSKDTSKCGTWSKMKMPTYLSATLSRYGHRALMYKESMYLFGGFTGTLMTDVLQFTPGSCSYNRAKDECLNSQQGVKCFWYKSRCMTSEEALQQIKVEKRGGSSTIEKVCSYTGIGPPFSCSMITDCAKCTSTDVHPCRWCGDRCADDCPLGSEISKPEHCPVTVNCSEIYNCLVCSTTNHCIWRLNEHHVYTCAEVKKTTLQKKFMKDDVVQMSNTGDTDDCKICSTIHSCHECAKNGCLWCATTEQCIDQNSHVTAFLYGQCLQWTVNADECSVLTCSSILTCDSCLHGGTSCGWCDDGSQTGLGTCMRGSSNGPVSWIDSSGRYETDPSLCPSGRWYTTDCPACQCNGHGFCMNNTETLDDVEEKSEPYKSLPCLSCGDKTTGQHCERCIDGYHGNALNGGNCTACECNGQATHCDPFSGQCFCTTKGVSGYNCDKCEQKYIGDPRNQTCFYELTVDFVFTFNLNGEDDSHITRINFVTRPPKISFAQTPSVDWMKFFVTFALCFFILLVVAFALWKIKQRFDRMFVEMAQMASRPFGLVQLQLPVNSSPRKCPKPIAIEPCHDYRAAVVTFAVRLPTGGGPVVPNGQSGLAVASALCLLTPSQLAQLQTPPQAVQRKRKFKSPSCLFSN
ncbi:plexin repeat-containing domain protein [Trichinella nativa]|uniref:Plexin repeat-containing domain protein n=1 Tax=Trichinella nativa TaxID=6335 RepID=A0A1Y3EYX8_9BILA|nr:plexin repeat-containing domain protein [Trichinella nativa]